LTKSDGPVAAGAVRLAARDMELSLDRFCPGELKRIDAEAAHIRRFVPRCMRKPGVELGAVIAAGVAHDAVVVADGGGERSIRAVDNLYGASVLPSLTRPSRRRIPRKLLRETRAPFTDESELELER